MSKLNRHNDQQELVASTKFPHASFPFENFNPVQSRVVDFYDQPANAIIAAGTSGGKTVVAEMYLSHEIRQHGGKGLFLAPLKALSQEKIDEWSEESHHFSNLKVSICTGDYRITAERKKELEEADLIIMSTEMLNSRARNFKSENNTFLQNIGTVVVDEAHLLTVPSRGDHLESGLMKYSELNPKGRIVFLSATMPNVAQIAEWLTALNGMETNLLVSSYRPCPLYPHYETYWDGSYSYEDREIEKVKEALSLVRTHDKDKFLIFVHGKKTGDMMLQALKRSKIQAEFHNADLEKSKRIALQKKFIDDPELRVVIATLTLAWGCNLPARRVIILGVHRGLEEVATYDLAQMAGRAGRPKFDPCGDVYYLLPQSHFGEHMARLSNPQPILSQMLGEKVLAFHIVSEIHHGNIQTPEDVRKWYTRTLASFQAKRLGEEVVQSLLSSLERCGAIRIENGKMEVTGVGKVASLFYYSPYDVADLHRNFRMLFTRNMAINDYWVAFALGNIDSHRGGIVSKAEKEAMAIFERRLATVPHLNEVAGKNGFSPAAVKAGYCYHKLLIGESDPALMGMIRGLQYDFERLKEVLGAIDSLVGKWDRKDWLNRLSLRVKYGVSNDLVDICTIPGIGKVKAGLLSDFGLKTVKDIAGNPAAVSVALKCKSKMAEAISEAASKMLT